MRLHTRTPGSTLVWVRLQPPGCRHLVRGLTSPWRPHATWGCTPRGAAGPRLQTHGAEAAWTLALALGPASGLTLLGPSSGPTPHGSYVRTHFAWVLHKDPMILGPESGPISLRSYLGPKSLGFFVRIQFSLVLLFVL